jgi:replicative DNA helicase
LTTPEKKIPIDPEAEKQVAGYLLSANDPDGVSAVMDQITPQDFHDTDLRSIIEAVEALRNESAAVDTSAVASTLHAWGTSKPTHRDMQRLIAEFGAGKTTALSAARRLKDLSRWRNLIFIGDSWRAAYERGGTPVATVVEQALGDLGGLLQDSDRPYAVMDDTMRERADELATSSGEPARRTLTGFAPLDKLTGGFGDGELSILAAPTGGGKSAMMLMLLDLMAHANHPSLIASAEMDSWELADRIFSRVCRIEGHRIRDNKLSADDLEAMRRASRDDAYGRIAAMTSRGAMTVQRIGQTARAMQRQIGLSLVAVDYLQLITVVAGNFERGRTREAEVAAVSRGLKMMARDLGVPVLALSQFSRAFQKENRDPELRDLRESGSIEHDANQVIFLYPPNPENENDLRLQVAKNRAGEANTVVSLSFTKHFMTFAERKQPTVEKNKQQRLQMQEHARQDVDQW